MKLEVTTVPDVFPSYRYCISKIFSQQLFSHLFWQLFSQLFPTYSRSYSLS